MKAIDIIETPAFVGPPGSKLFTVQLFPKTEPVAHIIYIPPFGEEMNRSRALVIEQARLFASKGYSCTAVDLYGTGDSQGELENASVELWIQNVVAIADFLKQKHDVPCILWGIRLGALLALETASLYPARFNKLILWQPVVSGKKFITQLLRLRIAGLAGRGLPPETTGEIRERLAQGEEIDVAGYPLRGELVKAIEERSASSFPQLTSALVHWFEYVGDPPQAIARGVLQAVETLQSSGNEINMSEFSSPPVWQLQKRHHSPQLIALTTELNL